MLMKHNIKANEAIKRLMENPDNLRDMVIVQGGYMALKNEYDYSIELLTKASEVLDPKIPAQNKVLNEIRGKLQGG